MDDDINLLDTGGYFDLLCSRLLILAIGLSLVLV